MPSMTCKYSASQSVPCAGDQKPASLRPFLKASNSSRAFEKSSILAGVIRSAVSRFPLMDLIILAPRNAKRPNPARSEEHTSELQSLMRISYAVFCLKKKKKKKRKKHTRTIKRKTQP